MHIVNISSKIKNSNKRALVCYIPDSLCFPFDHPNFFGHSNFQECRTLVNCLTDYGYSCDIIDFQENAKSLIGEEYDLLIAIRDQLEYGKLLTKKNGRVIMYSTACHWAFHNAAEYHRLNLLRKRKGFSLKPKRQVTPVIFEDQIDEIWYFGNDFQLETYSYLNVPKYPINISIVPTHYPTKSTFTELNKKHFLWFGSVGSVHKGLDWLLDIFSKYLDLHLHICGLVELEKDFFAAYHKELSQFPNIHFHGWVLPNSKKFKEITDKCGFIVNSSCSEGCSGSTLQGMALGLIPIISEANGIDTETFGFTIHNNSIEEAEKLIIEASELKIDNLLEKSIQSHQYVQNNHTLEHYKASIIKRLKTLN